MWERGSWVHLQMLCSLIYLFHNIIQELVFTQTFSFLFFAINFVPIDFSVLKPTLPNPKQLHPISVDQFLQKQFPSTLLGIYIHIPLFFLFSLFIIL